jgi:Putative esterase
MSFRATVIALVAAVASTSAIPALEAASHPSESAVWSEQVVGRTGPGSLYVLLVPHDWNRKLVVYAHGFIPPTVPIGVSDYGFGALWEALGSRGYAVAYSSYSENGFAVQDGALRTHQLRGLFAARFGEPDRTYLMAHSMGSLVALMLAERHPEQYSGAMPMCGVV